MPKFLVVGAHPPLITEQQGMRKADMAANIAHCRQCIDDGIYDAVYLLKPRGRVIIANAESEEELRQVLAQPPDQRGRTWEISELRDFEEVMAAALANTPE